MSCIVCNLIQGVIYSNVVCNNGNSSNQIQYARILESTSSCYSIIFTCFQYSNLRNDYLFVNLTIEKDWPDITKMPEHGTLMKAFKKLSYGKSALSKYMERHNVKSDGKAFQLLSKLLTMDPIKRITSEESLKDPYFTEEPFPTRDVFCGQPIPYPRREFLSDDDNDNKSNKTSQANSKANTGGTAQPSQSKRMWVMQQQQGQSSQNDYNVSG